MVESPFLGKQTKPVHVLQPRVNQNPIIHTTVNSCVSHVALMSSFEYSEPTTEP